MRSCLGNLCGCVSISESSVGIEEQFAVFNRELDPGVHCSPWCLGRRVKARLFLGERAEELTTGIRTQAAKDYGLEVSHISWKFRREFNSVTRPEEEKFSCYGADVSNTGIRCHLNMLLENPSSHNDLLIAISHRDIGKVKGLLEDGVDANVAQNGLTPLLVSILISEFECTCLLLQHGADANGSALEVYPLGVAAIEGNNKVIQLLVDHQADPNVPTYVLRVYPLRVKALFGRTFCWEKLTETQKALCDINSCLEIDPQSAVFLQRKAELLLVAKEFVTAQSSFLSAIEAEPTNMERMKEYEEFTATLGEAVRLQALTARVELLWVTISGHVVQKLLHALTGVIASPGGYGSRVIRVEATLWLSLRNTFGLIWKPSLDRSKFLN
ncbi:hypothetical protein C3L33_22685, partial [Rhododendron williamsianum]